MTLNVRDDAAQWRTHLNRETWPQRSDLRFIAAAFDDVLSTRWGFGSEDVVGDNFEDGSGYRNVAAGYFHTALMTGAFIAQAQPSRGGEIRPVLATEWVPDTVDRALATGRIERSLAGKRDDMWVYIDVAELELMLNVLKLTDMLHQPDECGPVEQMGATILGNMNAIAEANRPRDDQAAANRVLRLVLRTIPQTLNEVDQKSVETALIALLKEKFDADPNGLLSRDDIEHPIVRTYYPHVSGRMFANAWRDATLWTDRKGNQPYKSRRDPGRKRSA